ncbi:MAG: FKBP-type peptidyl-prolyl cis-trans isomerase [Myxococcota bacterium]
MIICTGKIAFIDYELFGLDGQKLHCEELFPYIHGKTELLSGMKKALQNKSAGDYIDVKITAKDAFGELLPSEPIIISKDNFGPSFNRLKIGMALTSQADGTQVYVSKLTSDQAQLSANHPLAGRDIRFKAHIKLIRAASDDEIALGYPLSLNGFNTSSSTCSCC